ncbi:hypothetical protein ACHAQH_002111 [Verticillium albo-atrum]
MEASNRPPSEKGVESEPQTDQNSLESSEIQEWSHKEELKARRKVDSSVLPLLFLGLLVFQLDRMNLASALTDGFAKDTSVTQETINLGNQLMFMGIVVLEIPSNMLLQKLGPRRWISAQVFIFGLVATMQFLLVNRTGFLMARLILGFSEAGYIPGAVYTLSTWYPKHELAKRVAIFFFGMFGGNALSSVLASGILQLDGAAGLRGWQWLFMLEGLFTICVSALLFLLLPGSPDEPRPLLSAGLIRFTPREQQILRARVELDDSHRKSGAQGLNIPWRLVWRTVTHWRRWPHYVSTFAVFSTWSPLTTYTPSIIMALGFGRIEANALAAVGASLALVVVFGMWVMSAISGLMVGTQYFRGNDTPFYSTGLRTMIIMVSVGMIFAIIQDIVYVVHNRRVRSGKHKTKDGSEPYIYVP